MLAHFGSGIAARSRRGRRVHGAGCGPDLTGLSAPDLVTSPPPPALSPDLLPLALATVCRIGAHWPSSWPCGVLSTWNGTSFRPSDQDITQTGDELTYRPLTYPLT